MKIVLVNLFTEIDEGEVEVTVAVPFTSRPLAEAWLSTRGFRKEEHTFIDEEGKEYRDEVWEPKSPIVFSDTTMSYEILQAHITSPEVDVMDQSVRAAFFQG